MRSWLRPTRDQGTPYEKRTVLFEYQMPVFRPGGRFTLNRKKPDFISKFGSFSSLKRLPEVDLVKNHTKWNFTPTQIWHGKTSGLALFILSVGFFWNDSVLPAVVYIGTANGGIGVKNTLERNPVDL